MNRSQDSDNLAEEVVDLMFKILIYKADPSGVLISKKNVCIITIVNEDDEEKDDDNEKLLSYFLQVREPSWGQ